MRDYFHVEEENSVSQFRHSKFLLKSTSLRFDVFRLPRSIKERKFLDPSQLPPSKLLNSKINNTENTANTSLSHQDYIKMKLLTLTSLMLAGATAIQGTPQSTLTP
jgi:hypothetical protein